MTEKLYSRVTEAEDMIVKLCEKQPEVLWAVKPSIISVLGIENKERSEKNKTLVKIKPVKGVEKAIMQQNNVSTRYILELYWSDWNTWKAEKRQWIILQMLLHIHSEVSKIINPDCIDFKIVIDKVGVNWVDSENLPNIIDGEVKFNLDLLPSLEESEEENDEIPEEEVEKKKRGRPKKTIESMEKSKDVSVEKPEVEKEEGSEGEDNMF